MRKFILIAGFVLASTAAQAGDRSLSLGGGETATVTAPAKATEGSRIVEAPAAAEAPKYIERPAVVEPKAETSKTEALRTEAPKAETSKAETSKAATHRTQAAKVDRPSAAPARPAARKMASRSGMAKPRLTRHWAEARIIRGLHRYGIYW